MVDFDGFLPIEEFHEACELLSLTEPQLRPDPQPAADLVMVPITEGSAVRRHAVGDLVSIYLPGHADVVRVESSSQTDQSLLPVLAFFVLAFLR